MLVSCTTPKKGIDELKLDYGLNGKNIFLSKYESFELIMKKFDVVIHYGGAGVTYQAISLSLLQYIDPKNGDQFDSADLIQEKKVGFNVRKIEGDLLSHVV